jgi:hypothetical protein
MIHQGLTRTDNKLRKTPDSASHKRRLGSKHFTKHLPPNFHAYQALRGQEQPPNATNARKEKLQTFVDLGGGNRGLHTKYVFWHDQKDFAEVHHIAISFLTPV